MKKQISVYGVIGVIWLTFVVFWFSTDSSFRAEQNATNTGVSSIWSDVQIKELRGKQAINDVDLMEAKKKKTELMAQIAEIDKIIEETRQTRRELDNQITGIINWTQTLSSSTGTVSSSGEVKANLFQ